MKMVATTFAGLETLLAAELSSFGASQIHPLKRAVSFEGDTALLYRCNYESRLAIRVLVPIFHFRAHNERALYRGVQQVDWTKYMDVDDTLAISAVAAGELFKHSKFASLKTKDAIVDQFRRRTGRRPNVELRDPTLRIHLRINHDECTLSLDSSGDSLHRRGYRKKTMEAPINEVLAAGLIALSGWDGQTPFVDPMCGSGTILIEAAM
ncbi:MAG: THUMP domain-containing protein, partial [Bacteroidota bacterium]